MSVVKKVMQSALHPRAAGRRLYEETVDRLGLLLAQRDGITPPSRMFRDPDRVDGSHNVREFVWVGESTSRWLIESGLQPHHRVLEIGCGIGRIAIPLTTYLKNGGSYDGLEITRAKVAYCQRTIGRRYPNFRFQLADLYNKYYNPGGTREAATYRFPYDDATFDFVFLISVFTHMLPEGVSHYVGEIGRVLKAGGKVITTFYLTDLPAGDPFYNHSPVSHVVDPIEPEFGVVYNADFVTRLFGQHSLHVDAVVFRSKQPNAVERQQDYIAATKAPFAHSDEEPLPPKAAESESPVGPAKSFDLVAAIVENPRFAAKFHPYAKDQRSFIVPCNPASDVPRDVRGVPVPPDHFLWGYTREGFLLWGEHDVQTMRKISEASGFTLEGAKRILDFGCGPGRMIRWLAPLTDNAREIWGADMFAESIVWCQQHLSPPFWFTTTTSLPHLPFEDGYFDFLYAGSVFTHIADLADAWLLELRRVVRPGGRLYLTICDNHSVDILLTDRAKHPHVADMLMDFVKHRPLHGSDYGMISINRAPGPGFEGQAQIFYHIDYVRRHWGRLFKIHSINEEAFGAVQTVVLLERLS